MFFWFLNQILGEKKLIHKNATAWLSKKSFKILLKALLISFQSEQSSCNLAWSGEPELLRINMAWSGWVSLKVPQNGEDVTVTEQGVGTEQEWTRLPVSRLH